MARDAAESVGVVEDEPPKGVVMIAFDGMEKVEIPEPVRARMAAEYLLGSQFRVLIY
jgi:hypothetical protein